MVPQNVSASYYAYLANPKSHIFVIILSSSLSSFVSKMFSGLMSLWMTFLECMNSNPSMISFMIFLDYLKLKTRFTFWFWIVVRFPVSQYSITMKIHPSSYCCDVYLKMCELISRYWGGANFTKALSIALNIVWELVS